MRQPPPASRRCPPRALPSGIVMGGHLRTDEGRSRMHSSWMRRASVPVAVMLALGLAAGSALAGGTLRIAMTASDVAALAHTPAAAGADPHGGPHPHRRT